MVPYTAGHFDAVIAMSPVFVITASVIGVAVAPDMDVVRGRPDRELQPMDLGGCWSKLKMLML